MLCLLGRHRISINIFVLRFERAFFYLQQTRSSSPSHNHPRGHPRWYPYTFRESNFSAEENLKELNAINELRDEGYYSEAEYEEAVQKSKNKQNKGSGKLVAQSLRLALISRFFCEISALFRELFFSRNLAKFSPSFLGLTNFWRKFSDHPRAQRKFRRNFVEISAKSW